MIKKILTLLLLIIILSGAALYPTAEALAANETNNTINAENDNIYEQVSDIINDIIDKKVSRAGVPNVQAWIDGELASGIGTGTEWYIIALSQSGENYNYSQVIKSLSNYFSGNKITSAVTRLRISLAIIAMNDTAHSDFVYSTIDDSIGKQGIMSYIFGLHILNNGYISSTITADEVIVKILGFQQTDGGFSLMSNVSDVDVTAMAIQSLIPYYYENEVVKQSVDNAILWLSLQQGDTGGFSSYGNENPESASQVTLALSALNIDAMTDERFIKNGNTILDSIKMFMTNDGMFAHLFGGQENDNATVQVLYSLLSYIRFRDGKSSLYIFEDIHVPDREFHVNTEANESNVNNKAETNTANNEPEKEKFDYKLKACIIIIALTACIAIILLLKKKRHFKNYLALILLAVTAILLILLTNFSSKDDYYSQAEIKKNAIGSVTITIRCDTVVGKSNSDYIPSNGIILDTVEFDIDEDDTVYDILNEAARKYKIHVDCDGFTVNGDKNAYGAYVKGINYLYEMDFGAFSGWVYHVNGRQQSVGCGEYKLTDKDVIEWLYTCDLGNDVK